MQSGISKSFHLGMGCWIDVGYYAARRCSNNAVVLDDNSAVSLITGRNRLALHLEGLHHEALRRFPLN